MYNSFACVFVHEYARVTNIYKYTYSRARMR